MDTTNETDPQLPNERDTISEINPPTGADQFTDMDQLTAIDLSNETHPPMDLPTEKDPPTGTDLPNETNQLIHTCLLYTSPSPRD